MRKSIYILPHFASHLILAGFATSTLATVATNISWSVIVMEAGIKTTGSGDPMLTLSRCNHFAESSSEGCSLPPMPTFTTLFTFSSLPVLLIIILLSPFLYSSIPAVTRPIMAQAWNLVLHGNVLLCVTLVLFGKTSDQICSMWKLWMRHWFSTNHCHNVISIKVTNKSIKT